MVRGKGKVFRVLFPLFDSTSVTEMLSISKVAGRVAYASRRYIQNRTTMSASASSAKIAVYVTVPSKELGVKIANSLLTDKLAACVNIIPGGS